MNGIILCPFQSILDIAEQLMNTIPALTQRVFEPVCELNTINDWVNLDDSFGDPTAIKAQEITTMLNLENLTSILKAHIDLGDAPLTIDNLYAILFLSESVERLDVFFYTSPPKIRDLQCVTSVLHERENIVIHYQHNDSFTNNVEFVQKAEQLRIKRHNLLSAMGFTFYDPLNEKVYGSISTLSSLVHYVWVCLKSGAYSLGCQVLEALQAKSNLDLSVREEIVVHLQIIRFLSHQHALIINEPFPDTFQFISKERIEHLYFIKSFAATLTRNLSMADMCFEKANISQTMPMTDEDSIYKLNLYALFLFIKGDIDIAFNLEIKLRDYIERYHPNATALHHVVSMNIARLYKKSNQHNLSSEYYEKAYNHLSGGGFTTFDYMNYSMDKAILYEAQGQMEKALFSWVKTAIYWFSCSNPYALAVRARLVLCQEKVTDTVIPLSREKVNRFLLEKINYLCVCANINWVDTGDPMVRFLADDTKNIIKKSCYIANNLIIYSCSLPTKKQKTHQITPSEHTLNRLISSLLRRYMNRCDEPQVFVIDTQHDSFYPQSREEALAFALLSKCRSCYYNEEMINLDPYIIKDHLKNIEVTLSKMILFIKTTSDGLQVIYKRNFLNKHLTSLAEIELVNKLNSQNKLNLSTVNDYCPELLMTLFTKKIISFLFNLEKAIESSREWLVTRILRAVTN